MSESHNEHLSKISEQIILKETFFYVFVKKTAEISLKSLNRHQYPKRLFKWIGYVRKKVI